MSKLYRIYCTETGDEGYKTVWSNERPTTCPNNSNHSVDLGKVKTLIAPEEVLRVNINKKNTNKSFSRLARFSYNPHLSEKINRVRALCYKTGNVNSFDIQIYNLTENIELININLTNTNEETTISLGEININPALDESIIEINIRNNTTETSSDPVYLDEIIFYT